MNSKTKSDATKLLVVETRTLAERAAPHLPEFHVVGMGQALSGRAYSHVIVACDITGPRSAEYVRTTLQTKLPPGEKIIYTIWPSFITMEHRLGEDKT